MTGALNYNEQKVQSGIAKCIYASSFGCDAADLTYQHKLVRLREQCRLNRRSQTNVLHVSLNFDPGEKLSEERLEMIASRYMEKIGFGDQPYLVYHHFDAGHPHVHILSTSITSTGKRIPLHNLGRHKSEKARKEIEIEFKLVQADGRKRKPEMIHAAEIPKALYGKVETKESIARVVSVVTRSYRFTSIYEFNAVLKQFNVAAIQGSEGSLLRKRQGLLYSIVDKNGKPVGVPIKASSLPGKPILRRLEKQFVLNQTLRPHSKQALIDQIDNVIAGTPDFKRFIKDLARKNVFVVPRTSADGQIYGLTYIDNNTRCVFNGSDLGKAYSAKGIQERVTMAPADEGIKFPTFHEPRTTLPEKSTGTFEELIGQLARAEQHDFSQANPLLKKRRKKKKRSL